MKQREVLSLESVFFLAEEAAREMWSEFLTDKCQENIFLSECLKYERSWMFFRHPDVQIPENRPLMDGAVVISSFGEVRHTVSYYPDYNACMKYLKTMSDYFERKDL
ncbi:hypothetical protein [Rhizobium rhizogenes]|jgi:hypothetical protein|uniref:hypothetical protein n=1 Tax=Rhizobium rhizogenes TaxID=359 RepID=UPI0015735AA9|nr:hypothetical protein [Rhizobium rhizogenes]NTI26960.1 hypothetical protein [Rhizobium rhizogenes]